MRTRINNWFDYVKMETYLGIDVYHNNQWMHLVSDEGIHFSLSEEEREGLREKIRRKSTSFILDVFKNHAYKKKFIRLAL